MNIDAKKLSTKYKQINFNVTFKESYTVIKLDLSVKCNDSSTYANQ